MLALYKESTKYLQYIYANSPFAHHRKYAERMSRCGFWHEGRMWQCKVKFCAICQWRHALMWQTRLSRVDRILTQEYAAARYFMLTISGEKIAADGLRNYARMMEDGWTRLSQLRSFYSLGWLRSFEIKLTQHAYVLPHYHIVFMTPPQTSFLDQNWSHLCQQSFRTDAPLHVHTQEVNTGIFRYVTKPTRIVLSKRDALHALKITDALKWTRQISSGGRIKQYLRQTDLRGLAYTDHPSTELTRTYERGNTEEIFPSQDLTAEQWYCVFDTICERLQKERGLSRREALAVINEHMGNCQLSSYLQPITSRKG